MNRREHHRRQRRQTVIDVAVELFDKHGYEATTVESIAEQAGISLRSFYRYFDAKDGVLAAAGSTLVEDVLARTGDQPTIRELVRRLAEIADEQLQDRGTELIFQLLREHPDLRNKAALWRQQWAEELAVGLARRQGRAEPSVEDILVSRIAITATAVAVDRWVSRPTAASSISDHTHEALEVLQARL